MSKKTIYILISVILIAVLLVLGYMYLNKDTGDGAPTTSNIFRRFLPFGGDEPQNGGNNTGTTTDPINTPTENPTEFTDKLRKLSSEPVAGAGLLDVRAGTVVRYIEKATGHIFETEMFSPRSGRISNTTMPQVYKAFWGNKNNSLVTQYLKEDNYTIDTYSINIKDTSTTTENTVSGIEMGLNLNEASTFGNSVFYLEQSQNGSVGYVNNFNLTNRKQIWNSPIKEVNSQYVNERVVSLTTKPHEESEGFAYFVDPTNGSLRKILGGIFGLSTFVSPDASQLVYLDQGTLLSFSLYNVKNRASSGLSPVTFPEKCVWSKKDSSVVYCAVPKEFLDNTSLTSWYRGMNQYNDDIWKYDTKGNTSSIISELNKESGELIDVINPQLSENEQYIVFINKRDNSLWSLDITK